MNHLPEILSLNIGLEIYPGRAGHLSVSSGIENFYLLFFLLQLPAFLHQLLKVPVCPLIPDSPGRQKPCPLRCFCFFVRQHIPFLQKLRFFHTRKLFCRHSELLEDRPRL